MTERTEEQDQHPDYIAAADTVLFAQKRLLAHGHDAEQVANGLMVGGVAAFLAHHGHDALPEALEKIRMWAMQVEVMTEGEQSAKDGTKH